MTYKIFSVEKLSKARQKALSIVVIKYFLLKYILRFWIQKNCTSKFSIKMFIKRKPRPWKAYAYQMLVSFKKLVNQKKGGQVWLNTCVRCKAYFVEHSSGFLPDIVRCTVLIFRPDNSIDGVKLVKFLFILYCLHLVQGLL